MWTKRKRQSQFWGKWKLSTLFTMVVTTARQENPTNTNRVRHVVPFAIAILLNGSPLSTTTWHINPAPITQFDSHWKSQESPEYWSYISQKICKLIKELSLLWFFIFWTLLKINSAIFCFPYKRLHRSYSPAAMQLQCCGFVDHCKNNGRGESGGHTKQLCCR